MKIVKTLTGILMMGLLSLTVNAQKLPQPSPAASFTQIFGVTEVSMDYSRPGVKGREIWGDLVAYDKLWRAGANASTKIEFSTDVIINGTDIKAGKYAMFIMPTAGDWIFVLSSYIDGWGTSGYTEESNVAEFTAKPSVHSVTENLEFSIDQITDASCQLNLKWEKIIVGFTIEANTKELSFGILKDLVEEADNSFSVYNNAAKWYLKNGDIPAGLDMAIKSTTQSKRFWNLTVLAEAYAATGDMKMAVKTGKEALEMSEKEDYQPYIKRNKENLATWSK